MSDEPVEHPPVEVRWLWRRIYTFAATLLNSLAIGGIVWRINDAQTLRWLGVALVGANVAIATLYLAGATVTDWARLAQSVRKAGEA
jgi:hypothetical protein